MFRREIVLLAAVCVFAGACSRRSETETGNAAPQRKAADLNVLLVTVDTLRADYLGSYGKRDVATPNMDRLAAHGTRFDQAIVQVPLTMPSHASILTGTYPQVHKVRDMGGFVVDRAVPTLAGLLQPGGFETAAFVGSAVLNRSYGLDRGFDRYVDSMKEDASSQKLPGVVAELRGETVTERALEWLEGRLQKPSGRARNFFLWVHYYDPHFPYDPPEPYRSRNKKDLYGGEVAYTDAEIGKLLDRVTQAGLDGRTLVVLMADHGESLGDHGEYTHGVFLYDSTMRVPLIVAGPGIPAGRVIAQQVRSIDVMPTILDMVGLETPKAVQGVSLKPSIVEGKAPRSNYCYMETLYPKTHMGWSELRGMRTDQLKLIVGPRPELYRLVDDRQEKNNLVDKLPADADRLQKQVWKISGPPGSLGKLEPQLISDERRRELDALGYVSSGRRSVVIDMSGADPKDRIGVLDALEKAGAAMNRDRWSAAVPVLESARREDPSNPMIYKHLQICYERMGQFNRMEWICLEAIKNKADGDETYAKLGDIQVRRGDLPKAVEYMTQSSRLNPGNLRNMNNLATAFLQLGRVDEADRTLRAILVQDEKDSTAHNVLGVLEFQRGRPAQARAHLEKAVQFDPGLTEAYLNLGLIAQKTGDSPAAIRHYRSFLQRASREKHADVIPKVRAALAELGATP
jgi:arylsulfatase A-like enzyme/Flp pilus assembly protein TadD